MAVNKYDEDYEVLFDKKDDFFDSLTDRCSNTKLHKVKPENIKFYAGELKDNNMLLRRMTDNIVNVLPMAIDSNVEEIWKSNEVEEVGLFIQFTEEENTKTYILPISPLCKLSLSNRAKFNFTGDFNVSVNKVALACLYEEFLKKETLKECLQIISVYGKVQAIMTNVYSPIAHDDFFKLVDKKLIDRFGENVVSLRRGYVSHKWSRGTWFIGEFNTPNG